MNKTYDFCIFFAIGRKAVVDIYHNRANLIRQKSPWQRCALQGVRGSLSIADYHCSHWIATSGDQWPDDVRLSDLEPKFACQACGRRGADVRPDWQSAEEYA
jgi:hypothetical protein